MFPVSDSDTRTLLIQRQQSSSPTIVNGDLSPGIYYPTTPVYQRKQFRPGAVRKVRRRAIFKNGECNILQSRRPRRSLRFLQDIFTTLVDAQWRWTLLVFAAAFLLSWLLFAVIWWLIFFTHGDLEPHHLPPYQDEEHFTPCVLNIYDFTSCFLYSIETQHTIGYGGRVITEECPEAIFLLCFQSIIGVMIQSYFGGIVFAKMTRPRQRTQTLLFSRNAVICQRDGRLCLMFRVGDMRKSHIIGASVRAQLIRPRQTKEGELLSQYTTELEVSADGCDGDLFFIWPMTIVHRIDESSPFYNMSAADMLQERFEIVVILEGTVESTGQSVQSRSSFIGTEILWGHRFEPVVSYNKERQGYEINYAKFDATVPVDTPLCSGKELDEFYKLQEQGALEEKRPFLPYLIVDQDPSSQKGKFVLRPVKGHTQVEPSSPDVQKVTLKREFDSDNEETNSVYENLKNYDENLYQRKDFTET